MDLARRNLEAALVLLGALARHGLALVVVCPGSRSAPLAVAAGLLEGPALQLHTALDERSAAFFALGWSRASGRCAAVITTSGTAVANLLPAAVEADFGAIPLLLISADRPARLKRCGANQTVNQEEFLRPSVRRLLQGDPSGLHGMAADALERLAARALAGAVGGFTDTDTDTDRAAAPGAVHLNLPIEAPLHADAAAIEGVRASIALPPAPATLGSHAAPALPSLPRVAGSLAGLDPQAPGLVVAGPWRGHPSQWPAHTEALRRWQQASGWPVLADGLSGLRGCSGLRLVCGADLALEGLPASLVPSQVLRLGPVPLSPRLQALVQRCGGHQLLITEGDPRPLDPLGTATAQLSCGLARWLDGLPPQALATRPSPGTLAFAARWHHLEAAVQALLDTALAAPAWGEPAIARQLSRLLPAGLPLVIANSSPVRDWDSFTTLDPDRPVHAFRGASGIDGTLSLACGVAEARGAAVLLSGDLALLHDSNGWLWQRELRGRLTVVLLDNGGGGIFEQLPIRSEPAGLLDFERLFAMPQRVDPLALAASHGVPGRALATAEELPPALAWALEQPLALLQLRTQRHRDATWRRELRRMASALAPSS